MGQNFGNTRTEFRNLENRQNFGKAYGIRYDDTDRYIHGSMYTIPVKLSILHFILECVRNTPSNSICSERDKIDLQRPILRGSDSFLIISLRSPLDPSLASQNAQIE